MRALEQARQQSRPLGVESLARTDPTRASPSRFSFSRLGRSPSEMLSTRSFEEAEREAEIWRANRHCLTRKKRSGGLDRARVRGTAQLHLDEPLTEPERWAL